MKLLDSKSIEYKVIADRQEHSGEWLFYWLAIGFLIGGIVNGKGIGCFTMLWALAFFLTGIFFSVGH